MAFIELDQLTAKEVVPGFTGRFVHTGNISIAYWDIKKGASIPSHHHIHEMVVNVIEGELELTVGEETQVLTQGKVATIPGNVPHRAKAVTDCRVIDVFYPVRDDYKFS